MNGSGQLVVGIGSAHGDDQAGWRLIDALAERETTAARLKKASVPHDMIDWMDDCQSLHVVDAYEARSSDADFVVRCENLNLEWITARVALRSDSSHQIGAYDVVALAGSLGLLPGRVTLWAIPGRRFEKIDRISNACVKQVRICADLIGRELNREHSVSGAHDGIS